MSFWLARTTRFYVLLGRWVQRELFFTLEHIFWDRTRSCGSLTSFVAAKPSRHVLHFGYQAALAGYQSMFAKMGRTHLFQERCASSILQTCIGWQVESAKSIYLHSQR